MAKQLFEAIVIRKLPGTTGPLRDRGIDGFSFTRTSHAQSERASCKDPKEAGSPVGPSQAFVMHTFQGKILGSITTIRETKYIADDGSGPLPSVRLASEAVSPHLSRCARACAHSRSRALPTPSLKLLVPGRRWKGARRRGRACAEMLHVMPAHTAVRMCCLCAIC